MTQHFMTMDFNNPTVDLGIFLLVSVTSGTQNGACTDERVAVLSHATGYRRQHCCDHNIFFSAYILPRAYL